MQREHHDSGIVSRNGISHTGMSGGGVENEGVSLPRWLDTMQNFNRKYCSKDREFSSSHWPLFESGKMNSDSVG